MIDKPHFRRADSTQLTFCCPNNLMSNQRLVNVKYEREMDGAIFRGYTSFEWLDMIEIILKERKLKVPEFKCYSFLRNEVHLVAQNFRFYWFLNFYYNWFSNYNSLQVSGSVLLYFFYLYCLVFGIIAPSRNSFTRYG